MASFDGVYERIGPRFLVYDTAREILEKFFFHVQAGDMGTVGGNSTGGEPACCELYIGNEVIAVLAKAVHKEAF